MSNSDDRKQGRHRKYNTLVWHEAVCRMCGKKTRTRFVPRDPSAVLCEDCFEKEFDRPPPGSPPVAKGRLHNAVCSVCGNDCEIPWKPTSNSPAVCWSCRHAGEASPKNKLKALENDDPKASRVRIVRKKNK